MYRRWLLAAGLGLLAATSADAAYLPGVTTTLYNSAGQEVGDQIIGKQTIPQQTQQVPPLTPIPAPQPVTRWGTFLDAIGRATNYITDGVYNLTFAGPNKGPTILQPAAVMALSPNPALQCPFTQSVNQTASTTVITNPGGKSIHVCGILLLDATAQGIGVGEGTGAACATGPTFWDGGSGGTMATIAGGGYSAVSDRIIYPMQKVGDNVCVFQSSTGNVSGHINYGIY